MCVLLIYLSLMPCYLSAQVMETAIGESADSTLLKSGSSDAGLFEHPDDSSGHSVQTRNCVNTFTNQTVTSYLFVEGCNTLTVQNVTVTNSGNLHLSAPGVITINGAFDVYLGGQLNVGASSSPPPPPPGNTMQTAINIGTFGNPFQYSDIKNTVNYTNDFVGRPANDVFYKFAITTPMNVTIKLCDSQIDTYVHLLNASGNVIDFNDDYSGPGACGNYLHSYLKKSLNPGTYYVVSEGYSANGIIQTAVIGETAQSGFNYTYDASGNRITRQ